MVATHVHVSNPSFVFPTHALDFFAIKSKFEDELGSRGLLRFFQEAVPETPFPAMPLHNSFQMQLLTFATEERKARASAWKIFKQVTPHLSSIIKAFLPEQGNIGNLPAAWQAVIDHYAGQAHSFGSNQALLEDRLSSMKYSNTLAKNQNL